MTTQPSRWPGLLRMARSTYDLDSLRELPDGLRIEIAALPASAT